MPPAYLNYIHINKTGPVVTDKVSRSGKKATMLPLLLLKTAQKHPVVSSCAFNYCLSSMHPCLWSEGYSIFVICV